MPIMMDFGIAMKRPLLLILSMLGLIDCAAGNIKNVKDTAKLESTEGILVTNVVSNARMKVTIDRIDREHSTLSSVAMQIKSGENFRVIAIPAGDYFWSGIYVSNRYRNFDGYFRFKIIPGKINYIGDAYININWDRRRFHLVFVDHNLEARQQLKESYPNVSRSYVQVDNVTQGALLEEPQPATPAQLEAAIIVKMTSLRDEMCTCHNQVCSKRVRDEFQRLVVHVHERFRNGTSEQGTQQIAELEAAMKQCTPVVVDEPAP